MNGSDTNSEVAIVIVGGGTAGWLTAAFLHKQLPHTLNRPVAITVIEAEDIPTVGVGEATIPSIRQTLAACGIEEHVFLKSCNATFNQGIEFINWRDDPQIAGNNSYFHPFGDQVTVDPIRRHRQVLRSADVNVFQVDHPATCFAPGTDSGLKVGVTREQLAVGCLDLVPAP